MRLLSTTLLLPIVAVACRSSNEIVEFQADPAYDHPIVPALEPEAFLEALRQAHHPILPLMRYWLPIADLAFVGEVLSVGSPQQLGSGTTVAMQPVAYKVETLLQGRSPAPAGEDPRMIKFHPLPRKHSPTIVVHHLVVSAPRGMSGPPRIDPPLFRKGARLLVAAYLAESTDSCGVLCGHLRFVDWCAPGLPAPVSPELLEELGVETLMPARSGPPPQVPRLEP
jgi:hypothetical protein